MVAPVVVVARQGEDEHPERSLPISGLDVEVYRLE
jgi:hypothetical protein